MLDQREGEPGGRVHADAGVPHVHDHDEVENLGVEALTDVEVGDRQGDVVDACECDHRTSMHRGSG
jgi:hypothetical protein